ncbi:hypothetical protein V2J09_007334 [Rumex salicifolius]
MATTTIFFIGYALVVVLLSGQGFQDTEARARPIRWLNAHATFYGANQSPATLGGACGYDNTVDAGFGVHTTALSGVLFKSGEACGACYLVTCDYRADPKWCLRGRSVTVTATNFCPPNNNGGWCNAPRRHFDMAQPSFLAIARAGNEGIIPVLYTKGQGNFNMVMISNVGGSGDVKAAWVKTAARGSTWTPMHRNWGANWQSAFDLRNHLLSFRLMLADRKTLILYDVVPSSWRYGQTFTSQRQFF